MERVQTRGDAFVTTEIDRLERLLGKIALQHNVQLITCLSDLPVELMYHTKIIWISRQVRLVKYTVAKGD